MLKNFIFSLFILTFILSMCFALTPVNKADAATASITLAMFDSTAGSNLVYVEFSNHVWSDTKSALSLESFVYTDGNGGGMNSIISVSHQPGNSWAILSMNCVAQAEDAADSLNVALGKVRTVAGAVPPSNPTNLTDNFGAGPELMFYPAAGASGGVADAGSFLILVEFMNTNTGNFMPVFGNGGMGTPITISELNYSNDSATGNAPVLARHSLGSHYLSVEMSMPMGAEIGADTIDCNDSGPTVRDLWGNACVPQSSALIMADSGTSQANVVETSVDSEKGEIEFIDPFRGVPEPVFGNSSVFPTPSYLPAPLTNSDFQYNDGNAGGSTGINFVRHTTGYFWAILNFDKATVLGDLNGGDTVSPSALLGVDIFGNPMSFAPINLADSVDPSVISVSPADNETDVDQDADIVVIFSEPMNTSTVNISSSPGLSNWTANWSDNDRTAAFSHNIFDQNTAYTIQIFGNDLSGQALTGFTQWSFDTGSGGMVPIIPENPFIEINNGDSETTAVEVDLTLSADNAQEMMISEDSNFISAVWEPYATSKSWTLSSGYGTKSIYVKFRSSTLDESAIAFDQIDYVEDDGGNGNGNGNGSGNGSGSGGGAGPSLPEDSGSGSVDFPGGLEVNDLIKGPDHPAVYFLGHDGKRHAFPNEPIYFSWFEDFSPIKTVSNEILAQIKLDDNVTMRPGTWLIKIQSVPKVYAVEPGGVIRWLESESVAKRLYGSDWNEKIIDIIDSFFPDYTESSSISELSYPTGSLIAYDGQESVYYIENNIKKYVSQNVFESNLFKHEFVNKNISDSVSYDIGNEFPEKSISAMMFPQTIN